MNPVKTESPPEQTAENLLLVIQELVTEVHPQRPSMEVISPDTLQQFESRFVNYGFHAEAMMPVYGLAESSVGLAYIANGEIYITGRIKDIIIRAGRNIYPHELEEAVGNIPGIRTGRVAVFGSVDTRTATERLIVLAETRSKDAVEREQLRTGINTLATDLVGAPSDEVVLAPPGTVLKTSSGKIRRAASREIFEKGEIGKHQHSLPWQVTRLALAGVLPQIRRALNALSVTTYAVYCWLVFTVLAPVAWLAVTLLPDHSLRWSVMRGCTRLLAKATVTPVRVNGLEHLPAVGSACVLVANHASYLDSYALVAALPGTFRFVGKAELANTFFVRKPLENIHTEFVERFDIGPATHPRDIKKQAGKDGWKVAIALRESCRKFILRHCGEPDLA